MQIKFVSVFVQDQARALRFYTEALGFKKVAGVPVDVGTATVVAFEDTCGKLIQLVQPAA